MKSWEREFEWHQPRTLLPQLIFAAKATTSISNQAHSHNHISFSLASHQKSVIYIVLSNKMSSK